MSTTTLSGLTFYYGNKTMVLNDDWTFLYNGIDLTGTIDSYSSDISGVVLSTSDFDDRIQYISDNVTTASDTCHIFDTTIRGLVENLYDDHDTKLTNLSSGLNSIQSSFFTNLSNIQNTVQNLSASIQSANTNANISTGFAYSSLSESGNSLTVNSGYNFNVLDGNVSTSGTITINKYKGVTTSPSIQINSSGVIVLASSDENLKKDILPLGNSLEKIKNIRPVEFNWNQTLAHDYGFTAQNIRDELDDRLVYNIDSEYLGFDYVKLIPFLIKSIQELDTQINNMLELH